MIRSALEPAIESLDLYMAGKYAGAVISGPVAMAAAQNAREFLSANYPNLQFQLEVDMTQLREGEIKFVIDIKGVRFDRQGGPTPSARAIVFSWVDREPDNNLVLVSENARRP